MSKSQKFLLMGVLAFALIPMHVWAQAGKQTQTADITSQTMSFNWNTNTFEFTGNAKVIMAGLYDATVTGPKMVVQLTSKGDRVKQLVTHGPVRFELVSKPDANGVRRRVIATAKDRAEYSEITQKIVLRGNAEATIVTLPETPESQRAHFTGDVMEADLGTGLLTFTQARMQVTSPLKEAVEGEGQQSPAEPGANP